MRTDAILSDWRTPPSSPWERNEDTTFDTSSLSWDTEDIAPQDDVTVPNAWDEGEEETSETSEEVWAAANEESTAGEEEDDSLPELVSGSEDSGYEFLNTPTNQEREFSDITAEEEPKEVTSEKAKRDNNNSDVDEEKELEDSIEFILNMEDPNYKEPEPCIGLTCPLTGEQYYVD